MLQGILISLFLYSFAMCYPQLFEEKNFKIGIEYDHSLPMSGGSDRFRHRNNYDPFFVTVTASAKFPYVTSYDLWVAVDVTITLLKGYVISYLEVSAITDASGEVTFELIRGQTGSRNVVFQLVSNHSDFLAYSYLAYGISEEEYKKVTAVSLASC